ncbi:MAG TPA: hypothetical protein VII63_11460 [Caulobacteraceae bacterium]
MDPANQSKLTRRQQMDRRMLDKSVAMQIKGFARDTGWRVSQGWLFREQDGWFFEVWTIVARNSPHTIAKFISKPMEIDPIFWDIVGLPENKKTASVLSDAWGVDVLDAATIRRRNI